jgi:GlpG protein
VRKIGHLDQAQAERFTGHLAALGIESAWRPEDDGASVWTIDEDDMEAAEAELVRFKADPSIAKTAPKTAKPAKTLADAADRSRFVDVRREVFAKSGSVGSFTKFLIIASIMATIVASTKEGEGAMLSLYYSEYISPMFKELREGQVWRLVTPIFMHAGILHLGFNMLWLYQLGGMIERHEGTRYFATFALVTAVCVNTAQYLISGPNFVGMSGVVYALLGYIWMMSRYQAGTRYEIDQSTVTFMIIWLVVCLVGIIPNVANTQHVGGFAIGIAWGYLRSGDLKSRLRRRRYKQQL